MDHSQHTDPMRMANLINSTINHTMMHHTEHQMPIDHSEHHHHHDAVHDVADNGGMEHNHSAASHMMSMAFHFGYNEVILFEEWSTSSVAGLLWSMLAIVFIAALYEGLKFYRESLFWKTYNSLQYRAVTVPEKTAVTDTVEPESNTNSVHMVGEIIHKNPPSMFSMMHFYQTLLHMVQVSVSLILMLIFMTYNVWLCLAVVVGAALGYFLFGWKKSCFVDVTEHCH